MKTGLSVKYSKLLLSNSLMICLIAVMKFGQDNWLSDLKLILYNIGINDTDKMFIVLPTLKEL